MLTAVALVLVDGWLAALGDLESGLWHDLVHGVGAAAKVLAGVAMAAGRAVSIATLFQ